MMTGKRRWGPYGWALLLGLCAAGAAPASDSARHVEVAGIDVYLGVVPVQLVGAHLRQHSELDVPRRDGHRYYVMVALFNTLTGARITDAQVKARVSPLGLVGPEKALEPLHEQGDMVSYGNFFEFDTPERYRIEVRFRSDGGDYHEARFVFDRPRD